MAVRELTDKRTDGTRVGQSSTDLVGFWGVSPVAQVSMSATPAIATTAAISSSTTATCFGFTSAQANGIVSLINALRALNVTTGLGST